MFYPNELIEEIREQNEIADLIGQWVNLKKRGNSYVGLCPFHQEKTPSFTVNPDKGLYYCFGCGASGNAISFVMAHEQLSFIEAVTYLAERAHIELPQSKTSAFKQKEYETKRMLYRMHTDAARFYYQNLQSSQGEDAKDYLNQRNISLSIQKKFGLGYSPKGFDHLYHFLRKKSYHDEMILLSGLCKRSKKGTIYDSFRERIMFPIIDLSARIVGFGARVMNDQKPKYLNSLETPIFSKSDQLYGLNFAKKTKTDELILTEGYMDVLAMHQHGFTNAVAALGTAFNRSHTRSILRAAKKVVIAYDSDEAGRQAAIRAAEMLQKEQIAVRIANLSPHKDPDDYLRTMKASSMNHLIEGAKPLFFHHVERIQKEFSMEKPEQKVEAMKQFTILLSKIDNAVERNIYIQELAKLFHISEQAMLQELSKVETMHQSIKIVEKGNILQQNQKMSDNMYGNDIKEAQEAIIYHLFVNPLIYKEIKKYIQADCFQDEFFRTLYAILSKKAEQNEKLTIASFISYFETLEEQEKVATLLQKKYQYENKIQEEKALNDYIQCIYQHYCERLIEQTLSQNMENAALHLEMLIQKKREFSQIFIRFNDLILI